MILLKINNKNIMKILLTGTQSTGKSTVLKEFENDGWDVITEVVRNLSKEGIKINEMGDEEGQNKIFDTYKELLNGNKIYISDRGLTDVAAYTWYLVCKGKVHPSILWKQLEDIDDFFKNNHDVLVCYFPIEFPVVDDGVRSVDEEFRKQIDNYIKDILDTREIPYITVTGTVEERVNQIKKSIYASYPL